MRKFTFVLSALLALSFVTACVKEEGPLERAGKRVDEIGDNVAEGDPILKKKGPVEKAGEAVDEAFDGDGR